MIKIAIANYPELGKIRTEYFYPASSSILPIKLIKTLIDIRKFRINDFLNTT